MLNINTKKTNITDSERQAAVAAFIKAGYSNVKPEMVQKVENKWGSDIYIAVLGDAMVVFAPDPWGTVKFVCF